MDDLVNQIGDMCHAIGFNPNETRKNQRVYEYYRNFFVAGGKDKEDWEKLVAMGYASQMYNLIVGSYYYVTQKGIDLLSTVYKIKLRPRK